MKKKSLLILILICCIFMTACAKKDVEWHFGKKVAREVNEDGWVYTFDFLYMKDGEEVVGLIPYSFYGINLRYRYNENYVTVKHIREDGEVVAKEVPQTIQILGESNSAAIQKDMAWLDEFLNSGVTNEDLLELTSDDLPFEELDEALFLRLVSAALNQEPHREGNYVDIPSYALLTEPEYLDDYKLQIGFLADIGCVDIMYIDVLYKTGASYNDYIQLSDMIDDGTATVEQQEAFELLQSISEGIVRDNDLQFNRKENQKKIIAGIDFARLYTFLEDIENYDYIKYVIEP